MRTAIQFAFALLVFIVLSAFGLRGESQYWTTVTVVTGCRITTDTSVNNQAGVRYYNCGDHVSFAVVTDSPGQLRLEEAAGAVVDIKIERVSQ